MIDLCILIPAYNEEKLITRAISSCYRAGISPQDIYVVDDGSTDKTAELVQGRVNLVSIRNKGKAQAIRQALQHFDLPQRYRWIALLDADSVLDSDYIWHMEEAIIRDPGAFVFCGSPLSRRYNWLTAFRAVEYDICLGIYREAQDFAGVITVAPGCASIYRSDVLETLDFEGGTLVEDMDLTIQIHRRGGRIVYVPDASVITQDPATLRDYWGQISRWYKGTWQVIRRHKLGRGKQRIDAEVILLAGEGLLFALCVIALPYFLWVSPLITGIIISADQAIFLSLSCLVARRLRRWDILWSFPLFIVPRVLNSLGFLWAFLAERRQSRMTWFSVERY